jgi:hypothetical protein
MLCLRVLLMTPDSSPWPQQPRFAHQNIHPLLLVLTVRTSKRSTPSISAAGCHRVCNPTSPHKLYWSVNYLNPRYQHDFDLPDWRIHSSQGLPRSCRPGGEAGHLAKSYHFAPPSALQLPKTPGCNMIPPILTKFLVTGQGTCAEHELASKRSDFHA